MVDEISKVLSDILGWAENPISSDEIHSKLDAQGIPVHTQYNLLYILVHDRKLSFTQKPLGTFHVLLFGQLQRIAQPIH